jgi:hypothetical protein
VDPAGWAALVGRLYERRAAAFTAADPAPLEEVYAPGSDLLTRDRAEVAALAGSGQVLAGFRPGVRRVSAVTPQGDGSVMVELVDEVPGYRVSGGKGAEDGSEVPGRGETAVRMVLTRTAAGWRIADAVRTG